MPGPAGPSPKLLGRLAAGALALLFVGLVWWAMSKGPSSASAPKTPIDPTDAPDITELETGESIVITLADKQNPGRVAGIIETDRFDPVGNGQRELLNPRGWLYPRDGRVIRVRADRGTLTMPAANSSPEAGTLEGDVRVLVYEGSPGPGIPPADDAEPMLTADFDEPVTFESRYLRLSTPGAFRIDSERVAFDGIGLSVMLNSVRDRIELIDVERNGRMEIKAAPTEQQQAADPQPTPTQQSTAEAIPTDTPAADPAPAPDTPKIDMYRAVLDSEVVVTLGTTRVEGERLELFARMRDNQLADGAFTPVGFRRTEPVGTPAPTDPDATVSSDASPAVATQQSTGHLAAAIEPGPPAEPSTLVLVWQGQMTIRPLADDATPPELAEDDAALALHAGENAPVVFRDDARGVTGQARTARYAATRALLTLDSAGTPVQAAIADAGEGTFQRVDADLRAGTIRFTGPGTGTSRTGATLSWQDAGELVLATDRNGDLTDRLTDASFEGQVRAAQTGGAIEGDRLVTTFGVGTDGRAALRQARVDRGRIIAEPDEVSRPRSLAGESIRVDFAGEAGSPQPVRVEARGANGTPMRGEANGSSLSADHAVATLATNGAGDLFVRTADATGAVNFTGERETTARADAMQLDGVRETIRLTGTDTRVAQGDSTITGTDISLDARTRQMSVDDAGRFEHTLRSETGAMAGKVVATWNESMRFDDALGRLICLGEVSVVSTPDPYTRDVLGAERIEVEMTPRLTADRIGNRGAGKRELTVARAYGGSTPQGPKPATAKTTKYDPANPEFVTGTLYLEGDQIVADARDAELRVPGAGTLLVLDRRAEPAEVDNNDGTSDPGSLGPGLTRFAWDGSMSLDREAGVGTMNDGVSVRHKSLAGSDTRSRVADLLCDTLTAKFTQTESGPDGEPSDGPSFVLDTLDARGGVLFSADGKRLEADGANYSAATQILHTLALPGRLVTLTEPGRAAPLSARAIMWDLARDQIEINRPGPVILPGQ